MHGGGGREGGSKGDAEGEVRVYDNKGRVKGNRGWGGIWMG